MSNIKIIKRLFNTYTKKFLFKIILSVFFSVLVAGSTSVIAWILDPAVKKIFIEKDTKLLLILPLGIIVAFVTKGFSLYFAKTLMIKVAANIVNLMQKDLFNAIIKSDIENVEKKHSGKFISNLTFDIGLMNNLVSVGILNLFKDSLTLIGLLSVMFYQNWKLSLYAMIMIPLASVAVRSLGKRMSKITTEAQEVAGVFTSYLLEIFRNHKIIKIFQKENYEKSRSSSIIDKVKDKTAKIAIVLVRTTPIMETLTGVMIAFLIFYSGKLIISEELQINNFFSFLAAMMLSYQPVRSLATLNMTIAQGLSAAKRILPIIDMKNEVVEKDNAINLKLNKGTIEFKNVNFRYLKGGNEVLKSANLKIEGGVMTSLVGPSGAGKTTILNLIPRFYDIDSGNILMDDKSIYDTKIQSLRSNISLVSQDTSLFDDTIKNNILYANLDASEDEIFNAAKLSFSEDFIKKLPQKYETLIGENGVRLSGGEKQRLSIARAMLKKSRIILLDEATSSLDADTESKIQEAINFLTKDRTTLVIAHRLSTIMNSNKIYVVNDGQIVDQGKHEELLKTSEIYINFYNKQLKKN
tara:strand:- start:437 stop:2176 length:1740 start_codon:yes stop_codon:yes gene_type:complete